MATMDEIAKKAGVSQATVSRVINGNTSVNPALREKVMYWVRKLDYQPNATARSLVNNKSYLLGLIIPDISNPYFSEVVQSIEEEAENNGYNIILCNSNGSSTKEKKHIKTLLSRQVDGFLIVPTNQKDTYLHKLKRDQIPVVVFTQQMDKYDSVAVDHKYGGSLAAKHLIDLGHTKLGFIGSKGEEKFRGYLSIIKKHGLSFKEEYFIESSGWLQLSTHDSYNKVCNYLKNKKRSLQATAFFANNDLAAFGAIQAFEEFGFSVPEKIAIVGFDNTSLAAICRPALTSIAQPTGSIGSLAVELLLKRINGQAEKDIAKILLEPRLVIRESTTGIDLSNFL